MKRNKKIQLLHLQLKRNLGQSFFGLHKSVFFWNGIDFAEHKEYVSGDPIKHIDWKASAKSRKVYTKRFEEERDVRVLFLLDIKASMFFWSSSRKKIDVLTELFYTLAMSAYEYGDSVWTMYFGGKEARYWAPNKKQSTIYEMLAYLEALSPQKNKQPFELVLQKLSKKWIKKHLIFILSDEQDVQKYESDFKKLAKTNDICFINILDYFEDYLAHLQTNVSLGSTHTISQIFLGNRKKVEQFQALRRSKKEAMKKFFSTQQVRYTSIYTNEDICKKLVSLQ